MGLFIKRKRNADEEGSPGRGLVGLLDSTGAFLFKMGSMGGFGYVVFGSGVVIVLAVLLTVTLVGEVVAGWLMPLSVGLLVAGFSFAIVERILAYRIAGIKLNMILALTEKLILKTIPDEGHVDTSVVRAAVNDVFSVIWGMEVKESATLTGGGQDEPQ